MRTAIKLPVFLDEQELAVVGEPASGKDRIVKLARGALAYLDIDHNSLAELATSLSSVADSFHQATSRSATLETIVINVGISSTGKLGLLGTGADLKLAATMQLTLRPSHD